LCYSYWFSFLPSGAGEPCFIADDERFGMGGVAGAEASVEGDGLEVEGDFRVADFPAVADASAEEVRAEAGNEEFKTEARVAS
jgi:hypothetical protein